MTALATAEPREVAAPLADGVYFGLDESTYHLDPALGSSDLKLLAASPEDWWHGSINNPEREPDTDTPARIFGSAVHKFVLEGEGAFMSAYAEKAAGKAFLHTADDIAAWTKATAAERGIKAKVGSSKAERIAAMKALATECGIEHPPLAEAHDAAYVALGHTLLASDLYARIWGAGTTIRANPYLGSAFDGGRPEVSVFWTANEIRRKARLDYVKARATVDLKSIRPQQPASFPTSCAKAIANFRYDVQAASYTDARVAMVDMIAKGAVHGETDAEWLSRLSADAAFVFVFYQAEGAPLTWGTSLSPSNPILDVGRVTIRQAEQNYRDFCEMFGIDRPWLQADPLEELNVNDMPKWFAAN